MSEHWYILSSLVEKQERFCKMLKKEGLHAFLPTWEYYRRDWKAQDRKPMFPGYIFVRSSLEQETFDEFLQDRRARQWGMIRQLKEEGASALRPEEVSFFEKLLDEEGVARMSYGHLERGRARVTEGPLRYFEDRISRLDRHNRVATLNFEFMHRPVIAGLTIGKPAPLAAQSTTIENVSIDLEELKSKMMKL